MMWNKTSLGCPEPRTAVLGKFADGDIRMCKYVPCGSRETPYTWVAVTSAKSFHYTLFYSEKDFPVEWSYISDNADYQEPSHGHL